MLRAHVACTYFVTQKPFSYLRNSISVIGHAYYRLCKRSQKNALSLTLVCVMCVCGICKFCTIITPQWVQKNSQTCAGDTSHFIVSDGLVPACCVHISTIILCEEWVFLEKREYVYFCIYSPLKMSAKVSMPVKLPLTGQLHAIANILASWSIAHTEHTCSCL